MSYVYCPKFFKTWQVMETRHQAGWIKDLTQHGNMRIPLNYVQNQAAYTDIACYYLSSPPSGLLVSPNHRYLSSRLQVHGMEV